VAEYRVARAAFDEAVKLRPGRIVTLRQKTRWLTDSRKLSPSSIAFLCTFSWVRAWPSAPRTKHCAAALSTSERHHFCSNAAMIDPIGKSVQSTERRRVEARYAAV
jgi:hypothetical protein